jgi:hypothetical protein
MQAHRNSVLQIQNQEGREVLDSKRWTPDWRKRLASGRGKKQRSLRPLLQPSKPSAKVIHEKDTKKR